MEYRVLRINHANKVAILQQINSFPTKTITVPTAQLLPPGKLDNRVCHHSCQTEIHRNDVSINVSTPIAHQTTMTEHSQSFRELEFKAAQAASNAIEYSLQLERAQERISQLIHTEKLLSTALKTKDHEISQIQIELNRQHLQFQAELDNLQSQPPAQAQVAEVLADFLNKYNHQPKPYLYRFMGLSKSATTAQIRTRYRTLIRVLHPDHALINPELAKALSQTLNSVKEILLDIILRPIYDHCGYEGLQNYKKGDYTCSQCMQI